MAHPERLSVVAAAACPHDFSGVPDWEKVLTADCGRCLFVLGRRECCKFDPDFQVMLDRALQQVMVADRQRRGVFGVMRAAVKSRYYRKP